MQQVHESAYDSVRRAGPQAVFRMFEELEKPSRRRAATALLWSAAISHGRCGASGRAALALDKLVMLTFFWVKYFDRLLASHACATDAAAGCSSWTESRGADSRFGRRGRL
jgi:hypothetical protein